MSFDRLAMTGYRRCVILSAAQPQSKDFHARATTRRLNGPQPLKSPQKPYTTL